MTPRVFWPCFLGITSKLSVVNKMGNTCIRYQFRQLVFFFSNPSVQCPLHAFAHHTSILMACLSVWLFVFESLWLNFYWCANAFFCLICMLVTLVYSHLLCCLHIRIRVPEIGEFEALCLCPSQCASDSESVRLWLGVSAPLTRSQCVSGPGGASRVSPWTARLPGAPARAPLRNTAVPAS